MSSYLIDPEYRKMMEEKAKSRPVPGDFHHTTLGDIYVTESLGDTLYVLRGQPPVKDHFPCIFKLAGGLTPKLKRPCADKFYVGMGQFDIDFTRASWRKVIKKYNGNGRMFGPFPDFDTAVLTYTLMRSTVTAQILNSQEEEDDA